MTRLVLGNQTVGDRASLSGQERAPAPLSRPGVASVLGQATSAEPESMTPDAARRMGIRNGRMMRVLDRIASKFEEASVPLLALKGAALNLTVYGRADQRPMDDLDLLVREEDVGRACALLEGMEGVRGDSLVREDFFPRLHYEIEYAVGHIYPVRVDLHVRPFRPLRYSRVVPTDAFWASARRMRINQGTILVPSDEDMLIHLATHAAIHACERRMWLTDLRLWVEQHRDRMDWSRLVNTAGRWRLALPVHQALERAEGQFGSFLPAEVLPGLKKERTSWCDRLALRQAPRDAARPAMHVLVNAITTPGWMFVLGYLRRVLIPDSSHMADWYAGRHCGWLPFAHLCRWMRPITSRIPKTWKWFRKIEVRESSNHAVGVFATRILKPGERVVRFHGRDGNAGGRCVAPYLANDGRTRHVELTGELRMLKHSCRANTRLEGFTLVATRPVLSGQEVTINYGAEACDCKNG